MDLGLPQGFEHRLEDLYEGNHLTVRTASRIDQIHFKLYALVDLGRGKHEQDLAVLQPTEEEPVTAAKWVQTHDPSPGFKSILVQVMDHLGIKDAASRI